MEKELTDDMIDRKLTEQKKRHDKYRKIKFLSITLSIVAIAMTVISFIWKADLNHFARYAFYLLGVAYIIAFFLRARYFKGGAVKRFFKTFFWSLVVLFAVVIQFFDGMQTGNEAGHSSESTDKEPPNIELALQFAIGGLLLLLARNIVVGVLGIFS